ncbi:MAG: hypothetical protein P4L40_06885 [Terracidiphilus sp.]|nr:hypothetical protein [Terracidiphilus sp.]
MSNFLHRRRHLSLEALDKILAVQHLAVADLLPAATKLEFLPIDGDTCSIPVVSHAAALFEPIIHSSAAQQLLHIPGNALRDLRTRSSSPRRAWQRFVAVRVSEADADAMNPLIQPRSLAVIDRHYTSLLAYSPDRLNLYAVRRGAHLTLRYAEFLSTRLVLRGLSLACPVDVLEIEPETTPNDLIAGRVILLLNQT